MDYLDCLNEPQRNAVLTTEGPVMIIAGAGSGKTRVLTYRIANLIQSGIDPFNILALTFTNKAAKEMRTRIEEVVGTDARNLWMGTFHSVFARILRSEAEKIGYPSNFTIYDTEDSKSLIRQILKENYLDDKVYKPNTVLARISGAKNRLISARDYLNNPRIQADDQAALRPEIGRIYKLYQDRCFKAGAMDFDDLLFNTNVLFKDHIDVLNKYQNRFKYVMVDEFQDTNFSQYLITRKLSAQNRNICVVGDDAQSIYAFRGADIQNILNFEKDYPELKVFKLEQNYRSTKTIVNAANCVITKNKAQLPKNVWTSNEDGNLIEVIKANSDNEEGMLVANSIFEEKMNKKLKNSDFAILYRTNSQSRSIEEALRRKNIKYKIFGGLSFYQRKEIKDLVAYLRFTVNNNDEQSLRRIINYPKRGIGETSVSKLMVAAEENSLTLWETLNKASSFLTTRTASAIQEFASRIKAFGLFSEKKDAFETAMQIAKESGLMKELYEDKTIEGLNRHENVQELLNAVKEFVDTPDREDKSLSAFLQEISLLTDADNDKDDDLDKVTLMTIHSSKGLEFKNVYLVGLEEDLFPSQMMLSSRADLEEERRLFYVAITRAEKNLTISYATTRYRFGRLKPCEPSRFLTEFDQSYIKMSRKYVARERESTADAPRTRFTAATARSRPKIHYIPSPDFKPSDTSKLKAGMKVEHPKFGYGIVKKMDIAGNDKKALIDFDNHGEKTLILNFAKLKIHSIQ
ncbi:3'-5' exonuclease [Cytophagaceae bacterium ABcell3]|nr:3'-5' exonuclease [Cytophagaceae bacterium ABcell3]